MNAKLVLAVFIGILTIATASAMDRWTALSMLESGDNDQAIGRSGEISRYQIEPQLWPGGNPQDMRNALAAAKSIMQSRLERFTTTHQRPVTDFEFYVLWNAPWQLDRPSKAVKERAQRFANLVRRDDVAQR